jgi:hypothetical protein
MGGRAGGRVHSFKAAAAAAAAAAVRNVRTVATVEATMDPIEPIAATYIRKRTRVPFFLF